MLSGIFETIGGVIMIVVPEPTTTAGGAVLVADGIRRMANAIDETF